MKTPEVLIKAKKAYLAQKPTATFQTSGWKLLAERLDEEKEVPRLFFAPMFRFVTLVALVFLLAAGNVVYVAQYSKPNEPLFAVKRASEQAALFLAPTQELRQAVAESIMSRRLKEAEEKEEAIEVNVPRATIVPKPTLPKPAEEGGKAQSSGQPDPPDQPNNPESNPASSVIDAVKEKVPDVALPALP